MNGTMKQNNMKGYIYFESEQSRRHMTTIAEDMDALEQDKNAKDIVAENCKLSGFSMVSVAGSLLMCVGVILYALLGA